MKTNVKKVAQLSAHSGPIYTLEKGNEAHTFFSGSGDKFVAEWNLETLSPEKFAVKLESTIYSICNIPSKKILVVGLSNGDLHVIDLVNKKEIKHFTLHKDGVFDIKYLEATNSLFVLSAEGLLSVWDADTLDLLRKIELSDQKLRSIDFNQDQTSAAIACGDGSIRILDTKTLNETHRLQGHEKNVNVVAFHPNGRFLLSGGRDAHLRFWQIEEDYKLVRSIPAHNFAIYSIVFNKNATLCATASRDKTLKIWDANTFDVLDRLDKKSHNAHINSVNKALWHPYKDYLISASDDRSIMIWDVQISS